MSSQPPGAPVVSDDEQLFCYGHPNTPTRLRCTRCERPICGRCAIPASVGQHCPECVAEARRSAPKIRTTFAAIAPAVRAIIIVTVVAFFGQALIPGLTERFASFAPAIAAGEWWRLLTSMVLHGGFLHIFLNMYVLAVFGPIVEQAYGSRLFVVMYVICGFIGSVFSYTFGPCALGVGASGAIFGMAGALLVYFWRRRALRSMQPYIRSLMFFIGINLLLGFGFNFLPAVGFKIDNMAHLGGLVAGAAVGLGFDLGRDQPAALARVITTIVVVGAGIALVAQHTANFSC